MRVVFVAFIQKSFGLQMLLMLEANDRDGRITVQHFEYLKVLMVLLGHTDIKVKTCSNLKVWRVLTWSRRKCLVLICSDNSPSEEFALDELDWWWCQLQHACEWATRLTSDCQLNIAWQRNLEPTAKWAYRVCRYVLTMTKYLWNSCVCPNYAALC